MKADHGQCRQCTQLVRREWRECPHCGASWPAPRGIGRVARPVTVVLLAAVGWWVVAGTPAVDHIVSGARRIVRSVTTYEERGEGFGSWSRSSAITPPSALPPPVG
jgi:hypothetical protein